MAIFVLFLVMVSCTFCHGVVYKVGDSTGWALIGITDYNKWASSKTFQVGDTFLFQYDAVNHNVLQVSRSDFHTCNATAPIATYASGNDSIVVRSPGHYFYICGFVGHCQAGQKVDIRVPRSSAQADASPLSSPIEPLNQSSVPEASSIGPMAPGPSLSNGEFPVYNNGLLSFGFGLLLWAFY